MICEYIFVFFKQKTAYDMRISDWSSDVCSSDLQLLAGIFPNLVEGLFEIGLCIVGGAKRNKFSIRFQQTRQAGFLAIAGMKPFIMITRKYLFFIKTPVNEIDVVLQAFAPQG